MSYDPYAQQPQHPPKQSLWRTANRVAVVPLFALAVVALLTTTGVLQYGTCDWQADGASKNAKPPPAPGKTLALSVRAGTNETTQKLREGLVEGLKKAGVENLVDNPQTRPRAQVVVEEQRGRYTPFWAPLFVKVRVLLDTTRGKDQDGPALDATITIEGTCKGLVGKDQWGGDWVPVAVDEVLQRLVPKS